ncbi:BatD family protein [Achromobacter xylosoxidans]|uniref:BatD family protein n=1 Tax=Alcaligenes xylosoxydans xylosoxydans TaxID=85698 RepID=UPI000B492A44|nr:BatD family protein [Achromobacter xylosoxidans]
MTRRLAALRRLGLWLLLLPLSLCAAMARAESADAGPQLRAEARMAASGELMAGATAILQVDVLTSTWFTQPPQLPALDIPGALVSGPSGQATIIHATIGGIAYSGLRYSYLVSPQAAGALRVPAIHVSAQVGQATAPLAAQTRPLEVRAAGPPGGVAGHALAASAVQASQQIRYSAQPPAVGDHVSRVITVQAQGAQAMLIPPPAAASVPGLKLYPSEPELTQISDDRGGFLGGQRVDRLDYVIERGGALELPAVEIRWWNIATNKEERVVLPAQRFEAQAGAAYQAPFSVEQDLRDMGRQVQVRIPGGSLALAAGVALAVLAWWLGAPWLRRTLARLRTGLRARREQWRASEPYAAMNLRRLLARPQPRMDALYAWLRRACGAATIARGTAGLEPALRQSADDALRACYGRAPDAAHGWRGLREMFPPWRRALRAPVRSGGAQDLPALNPGTAATSRGRVAAASADLQGDLP